MKLIVQIPCYNEAETLPEVVAGIPRIVDGVDRVEILVVDDGSDDGTADVALALGVDHVVRNPSNLGLARSFQRGIDECLRQGADVIVNTDGDHQYPGAAIPALVGPILHGQADVVVGDRRPHESPHFSAPKRWLQRVGSSIVRTMSGVQVADAVSGFRAYSRAAALQLNVITTFSYTTETLIHAGRNGIHVASVPIETNAPTRPSRLFESIPGFLGKQAVTMVRSFTMYRPLRAFILLGAVMLAVGGVPIARFLYFFALGQGDGHVQSLVLGAMFFTIGCMTMVIALLGDTIATNRQLLEATLHRLKRLEYAAQESRGEPSRVVGFEPTPKAREEWVAGSELRPHAHGVNEV
jgi:glycosyltransferase involved in cell wall biosynthesis